MSTPDAISATVPVGFGRRLFATLIDTIIAAVLIWTVFGDPAELAADTRFILDWVLPAFMTILMWGLWQATPGKMLLGVRIVDAETGGTPTLGQYAFRYVGYYVALLPLGLGLLWVLFDRRKRGLHDIMAGTMVVSPARTAEVVRAYGSSPAASGPGAVMPRLFPGGFGPWGNPAAAENQASLVWIRDDVLHLAAVNQDNLPGAMATVLAGRSFPARAVPLGALHSVAAPEDATEAEVTFAVEDGSCETCVASLQSRTEREEFLGALLMRLGAGWARLEEREARRPLLWDALKGTGSILVIAAFVLYVTSTGDAEPLKELEGSGGLIVALLALLGVIAGSEWVVIVAGGLVALCVLYMIAVAVAPPKRVALRRVAHAWAVHEVGKHATYR